MSELKRFDIVGKYADEETEYEFRPDGECYDADEVDKKIAEFNAEIKMLMDIERHQKYKRCLAMAKYCNERWIIYDCFYELGKNRFYERWANRWLELAEQFKEVK